MNKAKRNQSGRVGRKVEEEVEEEDIEAPPAPTDEEEPQPDHDQDDEDDLGSMDDWGAQLGDDEEEVGRGGEKKEVPKPSSHPSKRPQKAEANDEEEDIEEQDQGDAWDNFSDDYKQQSTVKKSPTPPPVVETRPLPSSSKKSFGKPKPPEQQLLLQHKQPALHQNPQSKLAQKQAAKVGRSGSSSGGNSPPAASPGVPFQSSFSPSSPSAFSSSSVVPFTREVVLFICLGCLPLLGVVLYYASLIENDASTAFACLYLYLVVYYLSLQGLPLPSASPAAPIAAASTPALMQHLRFLHYLALPLVMLLVPASSAASIYRATQDPSPGLITTVVLSNLLLLYLYANVLSHIQALANSLISPGSPPTEPSFFIRTMDTLLIPANRLKSLFDVIQSFPPGPTPFLAGGPPTTSLSFLQQYRLVFKVVAWLIVIAGFAFVWVYTRHTQCAIKGDALQSVCNVAVVVMDVLGNLK